MSYECDPGYLPTLEGLGAALVAAERYDDAQRVFQTILVHHRTALTDAEIVDTHHRVGVLADRLNQVDRAKKSLAKALELDPRHAPTLELMADLCERTAELEDAYDYRERLINSIPFENRFDALVRQGQLCRDKIQEPYRAIDAYQTALSLRPETRRSSERSFRSSRRRANTPRLLRSSRISPSSKTSPRGRGTPGFESVISTGRRRRLGARPRKRTERRWTSTRFGHPRSRRWSRCSRRSASGECSRTCTST
ncbi:MAG: tetratricopeptide repeat protein [Myxococcales bacterium]|nr:tetratricopeptide repeat protein [Myxococcales bacterium]